MQIHSKPGKLILPTRQVEWIGWEIDTVRLHVALTAPKQKRGLSLCLDLLARHHTNEPITARMVMAVAGFLNFVSAVIRQSRPYLRTLCQCIAITQVVSAWRAGKRKRDPVVTLSPEAVQDLHWWCRALQAPLYRPLHVVGNRVFIWHKRNPQLDELHNLAWSEGLVVVIHTDASGEERWGGGLRVTVVPGQVE